VRRRGLVGAALLLAACGPDQTGGGTFSPLGNGTATGSAASGDYSFDSLTTACSGVCSADLDGGFVASVCDVGARGEGAASVVQNEGQLQVDSEDSDYFSRMSGRIDADGAFDVRGTRTLLGGAMTSELRVVGTFVDVETPDTSVEGTGTGRVYGTVDGHAIDCRVTVEVGGARVGTPGAR
jgi:hypothetical protein